LAGRQGTGAAARDTWYLAEGTTARGFETCITIENPDNSGIAAFW